MKLIRTPLAIAAASIILAACGGGTSTSTTAPSITGSVIDGYIEGATVCLDLNANHVCDASTEPTATSDKEGKYSLDTSNLTADQIKAAHLITVVPTTAKDSDDGGKTLAEAGKATFTLMAPAAAYVAANATTAANAVITPLTTLVSHEIAAGNNLSLADAERNVRTRLNLPATTDLRQDFKANSNTELAGKAQMVAMTIAEVKKAALADTTKPTEQQAFLAALNYLQKQVADLQSAFDDAKKAGATTTVKAVQEALKTTAAKASTSTLVEDAKIIAASAVTPLSSILGSGLYGADGILDSCSDVGTTRNCIPSYWKVTSSGNKFVVADYTLGTDKQWATYPSASSEQDYVLTDKGWVEDGNCSNGSYTEDSSGAALVQCGAQAERVSTRKIDAAGKTLAQLGLYVPKGFEKLAMPAGSELYWMTFAPTVDTYSLYVADHNKVGVYSSATGYTAVTSIDSLVSTFTNVDTGHSGLRFRFNAEGRTASGGTVTLYDYTSASSSTPTGTAAYSIKTIGGQKVLIIQKAGPQNSNGSYVMFGEKDGYVYYGNFRSVAMPGQSDGHFNKIMMNAILKAVGRPEVVN